MLLLQYKRFVITIDSYEKLEKFFHDHGGTMNSTFSSCGCSKLAMILSIAWIVWYRLFPGHFTLRCSHVQYHNDEPVFNYDQVNNQHTHRSMKLWRKRRDKIAPDMFNGYKEPIWTQKVHVCSLFESGLFYPQRLANPTLRLKHA